MKLIVLLFALVIGFNYALQDAIKNIRYPKESTLYVVQTEPLAKVTFVKEVSQDALLQSEKDGLNY